MALNAGRNFVVSLARKAQVTSLAIFRAGDEKRIILLDSRPPKDPPHRENTEVSMESINSLSEITGFDRRTIKKRLSGLKPKITNVGHLYDPKKALPILYESDSRTELARLVHHKANNESLKHERLQNNLIKTDEISTNWNLLQAHFNRNSLPIPNELIEALAQSDNVDQCSAIIGHYIHQVLVSISSATVEEGRDEKL